MLPVAPAEAEAAGLTIMLPPEPAVLPSFAAPSAAAAAPASAALPPALDVEAALDAAMAAAPVPPTEPPTEPATLCAMETVDGVDVTLAAAAARPFLQCCTDVDNCSGERGSGYAESVEGRSGVDRSPPLAIEHNAAAATAAPSAMRESVHAPEAPNAPGVSFRMGGKSTARKRAPLAAKRVGVASAAAMPFFSAAMSNAKEDDGNGDDGTVAHPTLPARRPPPSPIDAPSAVQPVASGPASTPAHDFSGCVRRRSLSRSRSRNGSEYGGWRRLGRMSRSLGRSPSRSASRSSRSRSHSLSHSHSLSRSRSFSRSRRIASRGRSYPRDQWRSRRCSRSLSRSIDGSSRAPSRSPSRVRASRSRASRSRASRSRESRSRESRSRESRSQELWGFGSLERERRGTPPPPRRRGRMIATLMGLPLADEAHRGHERRKPYLQWIKLFVGSVPKTMTECEVQRMFAPFGGEIQEIFFFAPSGQSQGPPHRGACAIKLGGPCAVRAAYEAIEVLNGKVTLPMCSFPVQVSLARGFHDINLREELRRQGYFQSRTEGSSGVPAAALAAANPSISTTLTHASSGAPAGSDSHVNEHGTALPLARAP